MTPLFRKLNLGEHRAITVLDAPASFEPELGALDGVRVSRRVGTRVAFVMAFATTQTAVDAASRAIATAADGDAIVWMCYPKRTSKRYRCDFNRDTGWAVLGAAGFEPVRQVAIDADWSALRFRRVEHIRTLTRHPAGAISAEGRRRTRRNG